MEAWRPVCYRYDGTFNGFLTCVYESYVCREEPLCFAAPGEERISLYPEREVETCRPHARRVWASLPKKLSADGAELVLWAFLTCLPERERHIYELIALGYERGPSVIRDLTDDRVAVLRRAVTHLKGEAQLLRGFVRFSDQEGVLVSRIQPKNRVLPVLRGHFCARYPGERFLLYDETHREALFHAPGHWAILPLEELHLAPPSREETDYRALWRRFYETVAIKERENPKLRMTHMPKRYWAMMTEFQTEEGMKPPLPSGDRLKSLG